MKKWISLLLALVLLLSLSPMSAFAADTDKDKEKDKTSIRHQVYGDVSEIEVGEELDEAQSNAEKSEAKLGTDLYLFVDPDTASYVVFTVTDEYGNPIEDAQIWISYKDYTEYYGSTDKNGKFTTYLFRDVEYGYTVAKEGYETVTGSFTATKEIKHVRVVMRKYYQLDIFVVDGDKPVPGITVIVDGNEYVTDENGKVTLWKTNGVYDIVVVTPEGRRIQVKAEVDGDSVIVIDIAEDSALVPGGRYSDRFLVYNRDYDPEDYVLSKYRFDEQDVAKKDKDAYLDSTTNTILIEAQPERRQHNGSPDTDILDKNGDPLYAQRSLMPTGFLLKAWEEEGFEKIVFTNEEMALSFPIKSLHSGDMMKLYAILSYLDDYRVGLDDIVTDEVEDAYEGYKKAGLDTLARWSVELDRVKLDAIKDFVFEFEEDSQPRAKNLDDGYYVNSLFEFRLTPIKPESMLAMLSDGIVGHQAMPMDEIMLASWGYYAEELRRAAADGYLTEAEYDELYYFFADGRLSKDELQTLREKKAEKKLSNNELQLLLDAAADEKLYRLSCWISYEDIVVDISDIISGMEYIRIVDRQYEGILTELSADEDNEDKSGDELEALAEDELEQRYSFTAVDYDPTRYTMDDYKAGEFLKTAQPVLVRSLDEEHEFYDVISEKSFEQLTVDVRKGSIAIDGRQPRFTAEISRGEARLELSRALAAKMNGILLTLLSYR